MIADVFSIGHQYASIVARKFGATTNVWPLASIGKGAQIGANVVVGMYAHIGPNVVIGNGCKIQNSAQIFEGVTLEDDVFVGPGVVFTNVLTPRAFVNRKSEFKPTLVKRGASIGANATIICGVTIGEYAMIGAGTVVTKDVHSYTLVVGAPAYGVGTICKCGERLDELRLRCAICTRRYETVATSDNQDYDLRELDDKTT